MPPSACVSGIIKITFMASFSLTRDFLYDTSALNIWATAEVNVGILAASIPCLKPLFRSFLEKAGHVPKYHPLEIPGLSYFMQTTDARIDRECGDESQTERGEGGTNVQLLRKTEFTKMTKVYVGESNEENLERICGPVIVKTTKIEVHSEKDANEVAG